jgi:hypothetical protein
VSMMVIQIGQEKANLVILQTKVRDAAHWSSFTFREVLVHLVDTLGDVDIGLVERITPGAVSEDYHHHDHEVTHRFFLSSLNLSRAVFEASRVLVASVSVSLSFFSTSVSLK